MEAKELSCYIHAQLEEIMKYKWIRSEQEGHDIGRNQAALEWIEKYAEGFRLVWISKKIEA